MIEKTLTFRGKTYAIAYITSMPQHPSWYSFEDESSVRDRDWHVAPGDVVLDIGAAYGSYTLTALASGAEFVYAWSPQGVKNESMSEKDFLERSLELNGWSDRAKVYKSGIFSESGFLDVDLQKTVEKPDSLTGSVIEVEPLDVWFDRENPRKIDWMKLDVEGAEVEVLKSATKVIDKFRPSILIENHLFKDNSIPEKICSILVDRFGYKHVSMHQYHSVSHSVYHPAR